MRKIDQDRYILPVITGTPVVNHSGYDEACKDRDRLARELDDLRQRFERGEAVPILPEEAALQVAALYSILGAPGADRGNFIRAEALTGIDRETLELRAASLRTMCSVNYREGASEEECVRSLVAFGRTVTMPTTTEAAEEDPATAIKQAVEYVTAPLTFRVEAGDPAVVAMSADGCVAVPVDADKATISIGRVGDKSP